VADIGTWGARTWQVVGPVRVTSAGTLTGHDSLLFPPDVDSNTVCCMRPAIASGQASMNGIPIPFAQRVFSFVA
jgi:hypothetical protein